MTLAEYQVMAQRTSNTTHDQKAGHAYLGLIGECGELVDIMKKCIYMGMSEDIARDRYLDECGDFCWYIAEMCTGLDIRMDWEFEEILTGILCKVGKRRRPTPLDIMNRLMQAQKIDITDLAVLLAIVVIILQRHDLTLDMCLAHNILKLRERYPDGFDAGRSNARYKEV